MKNIVIKSIALKEWKGRNIEINFKKDQPTTITGRNGIGKTSVMKAFLWLLTGRTDANGKINSELFDNRVELSPDTPIAVVTATIDIDGIEHTLARSAEAKFTRKKGEIEPTKADSDKYTFSVDGLPYTATDYNGWISAQICNVDLLPTCILGETFSNFTENDRKKAREVLTNLIGEMQPEASKYPEIEADLSTHKPDELVKLLNSNIKAASDELNQIPVKTGVHRDNLNLLKEADENETEDYDAQINDICNQLYKAREKMNGKNNDANETNRNAQELSEKKRNLQKQSDEAQKECEEWMTKQREYERNIETLTAVVENGKSACPTCGTLLDLSDEELAEKKEQLEYYKEQLNIIHEKVMEKDALAYNLEKEANAIVVPEFVTPDTTEEQNEIQNLNYLLSGVKANKAIADYRKTKIAEEEAAIETLEASRKELGAKLAQNERKKIAADKYVQDAAEMLSKAVNGNLKDTRIQMFETLKNGEQKPSCIITDKQGIKYSTLNFSARMLCNVEIARMFCRLLDVNLPCFVDECSVFDSNHLPTIDGTQMIYMRCSDDQKLVVL